MFPATALIVDADLGFMLALSEELTKRDVSAYPARTVREARSMITRLELDLEVLVIDCTRRGAYSFAEGIAEELRNVEIIGIVSARSQCKEWAQMLAATFRHPDDEAPDRISHCADVIQELLRKQMRLIRSVSEN
jgi:hypothetical protein